MEEYMNENESNFNIKFYVKKSNIDFQNLDWHTKDGTAQTYAYLSLKNLLISPSEYPQK